MIRIAALNQELSEESCDADETIRTKEAEVHRKQQYSAGHIKYIYLFLFRKQMH